MAKISASGVVGVLLLLAMVSSGFVVVEAAIIKTFNRRSCNGAFTNEFRLTRGCQNFNDQSAVRVTDIGTNVRVSVHNQRDCKTASSVGQFYGPRCSLRGATALRSVYIDA